jgi:prepilin signal peptidase PulO-like enzyme (type II secretory pathway)
MPMLSTAMALLASLLFLFIVVYDLKHMIIPEVPMCALITLSLASLVIDPVTMTVHAPNWFDAAMGPLLFAFFTALFIGTKGKGVGFGDAKLSLAIGFFLGFPEAISAFLLSFWIGAGVGVLLLLWSTLIRKMGYKRMLYFSYVPQFLWHGKSEIPFAPFLALGTFLVYFFNISAIFL